MNRDNEMDFSQRNTAIDILRAVTMLLMIFVNDFWSVKGVPKWLEHATNHENFLGLSDAIFPVFLFVVGMSIPFAIERRYSKGLSDLSTLGHILSRTFTLLLMGIFTASTEARLSSEMGMPLHVYRTLMVIAFFMIWNIYPRTKEPIRHLYTALQVVGVLILIYLAYIYRDASGGYLRASWWGILGIIGWTYLVCSLIYLFVRNNIKYIFYFWLAFIVLCMIRSTHGLIPREANIINDLLSAMHIRSVGNNALTMGGILFSLLIVKYSYIENWKKATFIIGSVAALLLATVISNNFWIMSKLRVTPTCVFACTAAAIGTYGLIQIAVAFGKEKWFNIIKAGGTATLTCYIIPYFMYAVFWGFLSFSLPDWMKTGAVGLLKCMIFAIICILMAAVMERFKIKLKR
jgi:hypothetical protein